MSGWWGGLWWASLALCWQLATYASDQMAAVAGRAERKAESLVLRAQLQVDAQKLAAQLAWRTHNMGAVSAVGGTRRRC